MYTDAVGPAVPTSQTNVSAGAAVAPQAAGASTQGGASDTASNGPMSSKQYLSLVRQLRIAERNREFAAGGGHVSASQEAHIPATLGGVPGGAPISPRASNRVPLSFAVVYSPCWCPGHGYLCG